MVGCLHCGVREGGGKLDTQDEGCLAADLVGIAMECALRWSLENAVNFSR